MAKTRTYTSKRREQTALATRSRVLDAAKALFARRGIDQVTIAEIGATAAVAVSTVYGLFKSKDGILQAIMRAALFGDRFRAAQAVMDGVTDAERQIALTANIARAIYDSESQELGLIRGTSAFSPALRKIEAEFEGIRYQMQEERVRALFAQARARRGLDVEQARRILWMYTSRDVYRMLVQDGGWSPQRYQEWLSRTLVEALVEPVSGTKQQP
ncbi:MAG: TetR/AcrR family transcriptional regulator [Hyphomicrobium sp.]|nr:TetR/AcrR family transcriptional regulator [Hyphomicrobium sp.]